MNSSEKRRSGAAGGVLRAGSHTNRTHNTASAAGSSSTGTSKDKDRDKDSGPATADVMPAVPPRAFSAATNAEEPHDGGVPLKDKEKDGHIHGKESPVGTVAGSSNSPSRAASVASTTASRSASSRQKDRETQLQLRERDERISALEREMAVMEREFTREIDKMSQSESETATFWQGKHSALNQQFLRTDTELRLLRSEVDVREAEREELRQGWEVLRRQVKERDEEVRGLRGQVRGLKEWVSTSTRTDGQTSDEVFGDGMARLGNGLQNWVMVNFRKAKMDLSKADEATLGELSELVPMFEDLAQTSKVYLLQSIVSSVLVEMVFNAYYVGLSGDQTGQFRKMEELLLSFTGSDEPVNQWRSSTLALIRREAPQRLSEETTLITDRVVSRINRLLDASTTATSANTSSSTAPSTPTTTTANTSSSSSSSETRDSALRLLITNAIDLARQLAVQKAVLRVHFPLILPHQRVPFEVDTMEDIGGEDEDALTADREICCVAFPGIIKHGDESGGHLQFRNVITKARVLCSPED